jgi:ABC-type uncharacterized transport system ATPase subunit
VPRLCEASLAPRRWRLFEHAMEEPPVVVAEELTKRFGDVLAVDDLSFTLPRGSVAGFLGPNGEVQTLRPAC